MPKTNNKEILENMLEIQARKLAVLLYGSNMTYDVKESWLQLLPEMSLEQIDRLISILEAKYLDEKTRDGDEKYTDEIEKVVADFNKKKELRDEEFVEKIKELENSL